MQADDMNSGADKLSAAVGSGAMLREAREQRQLAVEDVAHTLRLTPQIIIALEAGDFASLGPAVFVRGYLRNYAKLLELPPDLALAELPQADIEPEAFRTMSMPTVIKPGVNLYGWVLWFTLTLVLLVIAIIFMASRPESVAERPEATASSDSAAPAVDPSPAESAAGDASDAESAALAIPQDSSQSAAVSDAANIEATPDSRNDGIEASPTTAAELAAGATEAVTAADEVPEPVSEAPTESAITPAAGKVALQLKFTDECWIEIADSRRSLLYGLEKGGSVVDLEGVPPFKIFVGNRQAVQVAVAGKPYPIPAGGREDGNTARFTVHEVQL